jgi:hypothetical protein
MHWRDIDDGTWEGLTITLTRDDVPAHPPWTTDIVRPNRVRITAGDTARWWARQERRWAGVTLLRGTPMSQDDAVVRPITSEDQRAVTAAPGSTAWWRYWSLWFIESMMASGRSPLRPGLWWITPIACKDVPALPVIDRERRRATLPARWDAARIFILRAQGEQWTEDRFRENWFIHNGSLGLLPLRRASLPESGRMKSWRKRAREGTLPPVLVHFIGALDMFVLLDGHDRYAAALAEKVPVPWLHVTGLTLSPVNLDLTRQAAIVREVARLSALVPPMPTASLNALYAGAFDDRPWPSRVCYGRLLAGGAAKWDEEVRSRLTALGLSQDGDGLFE